MVFPLYQQSWQQVEANADGDDADEFEADDKGGGDDEGHRVGTGIKTKRHKPHGRKKYKRGLS